MSEIYLAIYQCYDCHGEASPCTLTCQVDKQDAKAGSPETCFFSNDPARIILINEPEE